MPHSRSRHFHAAWPGGCRSHFMMGLSMPIFMMAMACSMEMMFRDVLLLLREGDGSAHE